MVALQRQAPNPQDREELIRTFQEWMDEQAASHQADRKAFSDRNPEAYFAPSIVSPEPPAERDQQAEIEEHGRIGSSVGSRVFRTMVRGLILAVFVGLVWQASSDDRTKDMIKVWLDSSLKWLSPVVGTRSQGDRGQERKLTSEVAIEAVSKLSDQNVTQPQAASPPQDLAMSRAASSEAPPVVNKSAELQQQLEAVVSDIADIRRMVEQLTSKQEQMSRDIAMLQAAEHDVSQKAAAPAPIAAVHAPARKKVPKPVHSETPEQPAAAALQTAPSDPPLTDDKPPRPPLPLLVPSAETPPSAQ
jgi:hypothetical protein